MPATDTYRLLRAFVDELARCGMTDACTSPGSRCTPIVLSLVRDGRLRCHSHVDERCAGFFALGLAKATGRPVAVTCTSGTAAANLMPAVLEAREARVPLILLTADRPPELRDVGAGQAIDQLGLYGRAAKWFVEVGTHEATPERLRWMRQLACRAYWTAGESRPGAVHLNMALREPLVLDEPLTPESGGRSGGRPWVARPVAAATPDEATVADLAEEMASRPRGVIVAGREERSPGLAGAVDALAAASGYPVLADPLSGARRGPRAVAHYDALLRDAGFAADRAPQLVLRLGDLPTSKPLRAWLATPRGETLQVAVDPDAAWQDPDAAVDVSLAAPPLSVLHELTARLGPPAQSGWRDGWLAADRAAAGAIATVIGDELSEPRVAATLGAALAPEATLFVAASMPVRDVETFFPVRDEPPRVLSNRGANGIDGTVSSAFGVAAAGGGPAVLLTGDVALAHDVGGLLAARRLDLSLTIVAIDNGGGGIFDFLPVAREADAFEQHVATPHGLELSRIAALYGCAHVRPDDPAGLEEALATATQASATTIVEIRTDRAANVSLHRRVWLAVSEALASR